jgi:hypothetical protein
VNAPPDTPGTRLVTILASDPNPGRIDRARFGKPNPNDKEPRPVVTREEYEATRAELDELRRRITRKSA